MRYLHHILGCVLFASVVSAADVWRPLFNGKDLTGWDTFMSAPEAGWEVAGLKRGTNGAYLEPVGKNRDPLKVFNIETVDGQPAIRISGQGFGTMTTVETFTNCHLRFQTKWGEKRWGRRATAKRDSGLLYYGFGELGAADRAWQRSVEFQIQEQDFGDLYCIGTQITVPARLEGTLRIYDPKGTPTLFVQKRPIGNRCVRSEDAEKPHGDWNTLELICLNGDAIHIVNGKVVMRLSKAERLDNGVATPLVSGNISLQTEGAEVFYRAIEIRDISAIPAEFAAR